MALNFSAPCRGNKPGHDNRQTYRKTLTLDSTTAEIARCGVAEVVAGGGATGTCGGAGRAWPPPHPGRGKISGSSAIFGMATMPGESTGGAAREPTGFFLREREWEAQASVSLVLEDNSGMGFRSSANLPSKRERAVLLLLALASLLLRAGERVALAGMTPPLAGTAALGTLAAALVTNRAAGSVTFASARIDHKARSIVFGDFLQPDRVFSAPPGGAVVQILDPAECDFPFSGRMIFEGFVGETEIEAPRAENWTAAYRNRIAALREAVVAAAQRSGQTPIFHRTDAPPATALAALHIALAAK